MENKIKKLTPREMEIMKCIAKGMKNKEIADVLFISEQTVKNHRYNILTKIKAKTMAHAVALLYQEKIKIEDNRGGYRWDKKMEQ